MTSVRNLLVLASLGTTAVAQVALPPGPQHLAFVVADPIPLSVSPDGKALTAVVPVAPMAPSAPGVNELGDRYALLVIDATAKGLADAQLRSNTTVKPVAATPDHGPALEVRIASSEKLPATLAAEYTVTLKVTDKAAPAESQFRSLRLVRPAAKIEVPALYTAKQTVPWWGEPGGLFAELPVRETSAATEIAALKLTDVSLRSAVTELTAATLTSAPVAVPARGVARVAVKSEKPFPLGESTGKLELYAPELSDPVEVGYRIQAVRPAWTILVLGSLGLLLGTLIRTVLGQRRRVLEARQEADRVIQQLTDAREQQADPVLRQTLDAARTRVLKTYETLKPEAILKAAEEAQATLGTALAAHQTALDAGRENAAALQTALSARAEFPGGVEEQVAKLRAELPAIASSLSAGDASTANAALQRLLGERALERGTTGQRWREVFVESLGLLTAPAAPLPADLQEAIATEKTKVPELPALNAARATDAKTLAAWLSALGAIGTKADFLARDLKRWIDRAFVEPLFHLKSSTRTKAIGTQVQAAVTELDASLVSIAKQPEEAQKEITQALVALNSAWNGLLDLITDAAKKKQIQDLLTGKRFVEAARLASTKVPDAGDQGQHIGEAKVAIAAEPITYLTTVLPPGLHGSALKLGNAAHFSPRQLALSQGQTLRQLWWINLIQLVASAVIYLMVVYLSLSDSFVGTSRELFFLFMGAFVWDLGLEAALQKVGELKRPAAAT